MQMWTFLCSNCTLPLVLSRKLQSYPHERNLIVHLADHGLSDMHHLEKYASYPVATHPPPSCSKCAPIRIFSTLFPYVLGTRVPNSREQKRGIPRHDVPHATVQFLIGCNGCKRPKLDGGRPINEAGVQFASNPGCPFWISSCKTKSRTESLGLRVGYSGTSPIWNG